MAERLLIRGGRVLDPASAFDGIADILIEGHRIAMVRPDIGHADAGARIHEAHGKWVLPGLVDVHVHLREPGEEYKEDIASGSRAAAFGGVTTLVAMPNTKPVIDNAELVAWVSQRGQSAGLCRVLPAGAVTVGQEGAQLAPLAEMRRAGAVALTDDGRPVENANLMRLALEYSQDCGLPILTHAEERDLSKGGHMHEGSVSTRLGLKGIPRAAEDVAVARDIILAELTGGRLHVCHVSTHGAVELIRAAKARGVHVTAEAAPHHFTLTDAAVGEFDTHAKMAPPLREEHDRQAVIAGLRDGTLDAIATDHAPHSTLEKDLEFADAANGVIGLQTLLPLALDLWRREGLPLLDVVARLTYGPARSLALPYGTLSAGSAADVVVVDPQATWQLTADAILSKSTNTPFLQRDLTGRVELTLLDGKVVYAANDSAVFLPRRG